MNKIKHVQLKIEGRDIIADLIMRPQGAMVSLRPICEAIGLSKPDKQYERIQSDPRFNPLHMESVASDGKVRTMFCLPVEQVGPWLYSINSNKVKTEIRDILLQFQIHLAKELNAVIFGQISSEETNTMKLQIAAMSEQIQQLTSMLSSIADRLEKSEARAEKAEARAAAVEATNESLWRSRKFESSQASLGMHAAKARKKALNQ